MTNLCPTEQAIDAINDMHQHVQRLRLLCLLPSIPLGGMERAAIRVVENLMSRGAATHFVAEQRWGTAVQHHIESVGGQWTGIPFVAKLGLPQTFLEWRWATRSYLRSAADIYKVFNSYKPHQLLATNLNNAYFSRQIAQRHDVRSIFRLPNPPGISPSAAKRIIDRAIWRSVYGSYDALVCNSHFTAGRLAEIVDDDSRIRVIRNFLPTLSRTVSTKPPELREEKINIVFIGQISKQKGVEILIDATMDIIADRDDVDLVLAGTGVWQDSFATDIRKRIKVSGLEDRIRFVDHVEDVHGLLSKADIHVCPSISDSESFPNVVLDAKQARLPSVVFPTAGLPEAVNDGVDGIVTESCNKEALVSALLRLINDKPLRELMGADATHSLSAYQDEKITVDWISVFID